MPGGRGFPSRRQGVLPTRFRCKVGGEYKSLEEFSDNQRKFLQRQIDSGQSVDPNHSGMTCREHSAMKRDEIQCERCGLVKHLDEFSKSSRRNGTNECKRCVAWTETQEPDVTPAPLETGTISLDETNNEMWPKDFTHSGDFFDENDPPQAPVTDLDSLTSMLDNSTISGYSTTASVSGDSVVTNGARQPSLPPHLARFSEASMSGSVVSVVQERVVPNQSAAPMNNVNALPLHLRPKKVNRTEEPTSPPQLRDTSIYAASISTATTAREAKREDARAQAVQFNAWDPSGKQHLQVKEPTITSSSASSVGESSDANSGLGEWTPAPSRKQKNGRSNNKWPKRSEMNISRSEMKKKPFLNYPTQMTEWHVNLDIDSQRRWASRPE